MSARPSGSTTAYIARDTIPKVRELATAEFATLRLRLVKIAARVVETASRIRLVRRGMSRSRPDPLLAKRAAAARSLTGGACAPVRPTHPSSALQSTGRQAVKSRRQSCVHRQRRCAAASIRPKTALSPRVNNLDWENAWVDLGPSTAGNQGPYWHVPLKETTANYTTAGIPFIGFTRRCKKGDADVSCVLRNAAQSSVANPHCWPMSPAPLRGENSHFPYRPLNRFWPVKDVLEAWRGLQLGVV
jgi:hypothetical protein